MMIITLCLCCTVVIPTMYKQINTDANAVDMLTRQEYYSLMVRDNVPSFREDKKDEANRALLAAQRVPIPPAVSSHTPQLFGKRIFGPETAQKTLLCVHGTGTGKCHGWNTAIMMSDWSTKMVQSITVGDHVMGDDGTPRRVTDTFVGYGQMFCLKTRLTSFTCTLDHTLCLLCVDTGEIKELTLREYIALGGSAANLRLYKFAAHVKKGVFLVDRIKEIESLGVVDATPKQFTVWTQAAATELVDTANASGFDATWCALQSGDFAVTIMKHTGCFEVIHVAQATHYGFETDGNHRYLLANCVVTHNSYTALGISANFTDAYKKIYKAVLDRQPEGSIDYAWVNKNTPSVFVLGWEATTRAFMRDLLKYPEFGFITEAELQELRKREHAALSGLPDQIAFAREFRSMLKHRVQNKAKNGFYQFYGYIEFVNRLFSGKPLVDVEREVHAEIKNGNKVSLEQRVTEYIKSGEIVVNKEFVAQFHGSLVIVDEFHNLYNSVTKNNRGVALFYLLSTVPDMYLLGLTATPANSPTEVLEYLSLLRVTTLRKDDFFAGRNLLPGALDKIVQLSRGVISFLQDVDLKYFPVRVQRGEPISIEPGPADNLPRGVIPYLLFTPCPMSKLHQETLEKFISEGISGEDDVDEEDEVEFDGESEKIAIPVSGLAIYDMVFPGGYFRSRETKAAILGWSALEKQERQIDLKKTGTATVITGDFLRAENIGVYSTKYATLWRILHDGILATKGNPKDAKKTLIYHNAVRMSGTTLIQEMLCVNGFIYRNEAPNRNTICFHCGTKMSDHEQLASGISAHPFVPARLINIHSEIEKSALDEQLTSYQSAANLYGEIIGVVIGSKKIKEGYELPHTRRLIVTSAPANITTYLQVEGRVSRKGSHSLLPADKRDVEVYILVSTINPDYQHTQTISPEVYRYAEKLRDYQIIQRIEQVQNENAIDGPILYGINMSSALREKTKMAALGNLYFEPSVKLPDVQSPSVDTFYAYGWAKDEIKMITYAISRLLLMQSGWTYDALWETVRSPPFSMEVNPALFQENNFIVALAQLCSQPVIFGGMQYRVSKVGQYYCLFPARGGSAIIDAETFLRPITATQNVTVYLKDYLAASNVDLLYAQQRTKFIACLSSGTHVSSFLLDYSKDFQCYMVETAIHALLTDSETDRQAHTTLLDYLDGYGCCVRKQEVWKYKDVVKQFSPEMASIPDNKYIGYCTHSAVKIYDVIVQKWVSINRVALNKNLPYQESSIVGFLEPKGDRIIFKLRGKAPDVKDKRLIPSGSACDTKSRADLLLIAKQIGISTKEQAGNSIKPICVAIREHLMNQEQRERRRKSLVKYLYGWWDIQN